MRIGVHGRTDLSASIAKRVYAFFVAAKLPTSTFANWQLHRIWPANYIELIEWIKFIVAAAQIHLRVHDIKYEFVETSPIY